MSKKTIGVIGLGSIGLRHAKNLLKLGHQVYGYDSNRENIAFGAIKTADTIESVMDCDAIVIASPTSTHADYAQKAILAEKPVFVEKPIADWIFPGADLITMVGFNLRFRECVKKAKHWFDNGFIGEPFWGNFTVSQYNDRPDYLRDGVILNFASHEIDLALFFLGSGNVTAASARFTNGNDDLADILITHQNGCHSTIHSDYLTSPEVRQTIIVGTDATIILDIVNGYGWLRNKHGTLIDQIAGEDSFSSNYVDEIKAFIDRIDGKQETGATGQDGLDALKICLQARTKIGTH